MNITDKISLMLSAKSDIKQAIEDKGQDMTNVPFSSYATKINEITSGSTVLGLTQKEITEGGVFSWTIVDNSSASYIGKCAFKWCSNISRVSLPACKSIETGGLQRCTGLNQVAIPNCEYIGLNAFDGDTKLQWITLSKVSIIVRNAFINCTALVQVTLNNCKTVGSSAFINCYTMSSIGSTPMIEYVGSNAFKRCSSLTVIDIPKCSFIGNEAFAYCSALNTITVGTSLSTICSLDGSSAFYSCPALSSIYVPSSLVNTYKSAPYWSDYSNIIIGI